MTSSEHARALANQAALARLHAVCPQWSNVCSAGEAVGLSGMTLLHAGPPFREGQRPSEVVLSSAVMACLQEGWAQDEAEAERLILDGRVQLRSAQELGVVTPLAAVISPRTALVEIGDAQSPEASPVWSLLASGAGVQIRFGTRAPGLLERLDWRDQVLAPAMRKVLAQGALELIPLARQGLEGDDDLHACTTMATRALVDALRERLTADAQVLDMLESTPLFFLTLWMGACHLMLSRAVGDVPDPAGSLVVALAGNGVDAGFRLSGAPHTWQRTPAPVPSGPRLKDIAVQAAPMTGDSGVIDAAGFGAQAWGLATQVAEGMAGWLPGPVPPRCAWLVGEHPAFADFGLGSAIDVEAISLEQHAPRVAIAMLAADGRQGLLGRGSCAISTDWLQPRLRQGLSINTATALDELTRSFERYEQALVSNDTAVLDELFWGSAHTLRYGATEELYGIEAIRAFRQQRPGTGLARQILQRSVVTFGDDFGVANMSFRREGSPRIGRQTQTWARLQGRWQVVAAHVSWSDA